MNKPNYKANLVASPYPHKIIFNQGLKLPFLFYNFNHRVFESSTNRWLRYAGNVRKLGRKIFKTVRRCHFQSGLCCLLPVVH